MIAPDSIRQKKADLPVRELQREFTELLRAAGIENADLDARVLIAKAAGIEAQELLANADKILDENIRSKLQDMVERRIAGEPVARITGTKEFWSREFLLGPDTLVPRPESETIVEAALEMKPDLDAPLRVLDLGTGTGALLAALLLERPNAFGVGTDRSLGALNVARVNLWRLGLSSRAVFFCGDWGAAVRQDFDLVVANPPYVERSVIASLQPEVRDHDPALALDGGPDGLDAYRAICSDLPRLLAPEGAAILELGRGQERAVGDIAMRANLIVNSVKSDLSGCPRALILAAGKDKKTLGSIREQH